jgi:hypothetical protein
MIISSKFFVLGILRNIYMFNWHLHLITPLLYYNLLIISYVNTLAFPFMLLFTAIVVITITLFESFFAISFKDFLVTPLLGLFVVPFDKPLILPMEKQPPFLVMTKVQQL